MDFKTYHDNLVKKLFDKAKSLDQDAKDELIPYLEKCIEFMKLDEQDIECDWASLKPLKNEQAISLFDCELTDITIGCHYDYNDIIELDNQLIDVLKGKE